MADEFNIATDIKIEINLPQALSGVWNSSQWNDGSDWMTTAGSAFAWTDVVATISQASIEIGNSVQDGYYVPAAPNTMTLQMQSGTYDPNNNKYMRPNLGIRFSYRPNPTTAPSTWVVLFLGYIDTLHVSYDTFGNTLIDITASSSLKRLLAKNLTSFAFDGVLASTNLYQNWFTAVSAVAGSSFNAIDYIPPAETFANLGAGEVFDYLNQSQAGFVYQEPDTEKVIGRNFQSVRGLFNTPATNSLSNTHTSASTHFCISDIVIDYDIDSAWNTYLFSTNAAPSTIYKKINQDLIDLYGDIRLEKTLHVDSTNLQYYMDFMTLKNPGRKVSQVTTPAIRRDGLLANMAALLPNRTINVNVSKTSYTVNEDTFITKATHTFDPYNWFVTLEVWKGF
jgi:hypothetical protein